MRFFFYSILILALGSCDFSPDISYEETKADTNQVTASEAARNAHTSENSLDWQGFYAGNIPCVDCEAIKMTVRLRKNSTYTGSSIYLGKNPKPLPANGTFVWSDDGNSIILSGDAGGTREYRVVEGGLILSNNQGQKLEGKLKNRYILTKADAQTEIENWHWTLTEINGRKIQESEKKSVPYFRLNSFEKEVTGSFGCNRFFGTYFIGDRDSISFSKLGSTRMACLDMTLENQLKAFMNKVEFYTLVNDTTLVLSSNIAKNIAVFTRKRS